MNKNLLMALLLAGIWVLAPASLRAQSSTGSQTQSAGAQNDSRIADQDIELLRKDLRGQKKQLVAANLKLTVDQPPNFGQCTTNTSRIRRKSTTRSML